MQLRVMASRYAIDSRSSCSCLTVRIEAGDSRSAHFGSSSRRAASSPALVGSRDGQRRLEEANGRAERKQWKQQIRIERRRGHGRNRTAHRRLLRQCSHFQLLALLSLFNRLRLLALLHSRSVMTVEEVEIQCRLRGKRFRAIRARWCAAAERFVAVGRRSAVGSRLQRSAVRPRARRAGSSVHACGQIRGRHSVRVNAVLVEGQE